VKIIFWGTPEFAIPSLNAIIESEHELVAVVTQPDKRRGRGKTITPSPVKRRALEQGIQVFTPENIKKQTEIKNKILSLNADLYLVVAFGQLLPTDVLEGPPLGSWNCHASLLPRWRGAAPIQWSLLQGDKTTGVAIMAMEEDLDTGPILTSRNVEIGLLDNYRDLSEKLSLISAELLIDSLLKIELVGQGEQFYRLNKLGITCQRDLEVIPTYARMIKKEDYLINWFKSSFEIHKKIMALYPNAHTYRGKTRIKILNSIPLSEDYGTYLPKAVSKNLQNIVINNESPGTIIEVIENIGFVVSTTTLPILITEIQIEGKRITSGRSMLQQFKPKVKDLMLNF